MSRINVDALHSEDGGSSNIELDDSRNVTFKGNAQVDGNVTVTGTIPANKLTGALPAISGASLTGITSNPPPFRNLIINGAMNIHQRIDQGTMQTGTSGYTCDRWRWWDGTGGVYTWGPSTDAPAGFRKSHHVDCAISGSPSGDEYSAILYKVEANDLTHLKYNTSDAQSLTLSFWVKSNLTGDWAVSLRKKEGTDRNITKTYTINAANTWEKKTITFPGDTSGGGIDMSNDGINEGLRITFCAQAGANNKGGTGADSWHNWIANKWFEGHDVDLGSSASNDWRITGVQLEVGDTATDFEHRSYADELARCLRYYWVVARGNDIAIVSGYSHSSTYLNWLHRFPVPMRTTPSLVHTTGTDYYNVEQHGTHYYLTGFGGVERGNAYAIQTWTALSASQGSGCRVRTYNASASVAYNAEI